jgi:hypothetical protein
MGEDGQLLRRRSGNINQLLQNLHWKTLRYYMTVMITTQILMGWTLVSVQMQFQEALKKCSPIDVDKE